MSRTPIKPQAKKAPDMDAGVCKPTPRKRSPKCAVAVVTDKEAMAPGRASARAKSSRQRMIDAQNALHETVDKLEAKTAGHDSFRDSLKRGDVARKQSMRAWEETHFPYDEPDYMAENARKRQEATDTWLTVATVFGVIMIIAIMAWWVV